MNATDNDDRGEQPSWLRASMASEPLAGEAGEALFAEIANQSGKNRRKGPRRGFWTEVGLLARLARSVAKGEYDLASTQIAALVSALAYVVSPVDAVPDVLPAVGLVDDAGVVAATITLLSYELFQYREWEMAHQAA